MKLNTGNKTTKFINQMDSKAVTGTILAGGASSRMGKDKGLCMFKGKELVAYSIEVLKPICDKIIISTNNPQDYHKFGLPMVEDDIRNIGPIGGIYSCLKQSNTLRNLLISCDMPFLETAALDYILSKSDNFDLVVPQHSNSYYEPLAGYYSTTIIPSIEDSIHHMDYKLINLFSKVKFLAIAAEKLPGRAKQFGNMNTPEDLL